MKQVQRFIKIIPHSQQCIEDEKGENIRGIGAATAHQAPLKLQEALCELAPRLHIQAKKLRSGNVFALSQSIKASAPSVAVAQRRVRRARQLALQVVAHSLHLRDRPETLELCQVWRFHLPCVKNRYLR